MTTELLERIRIRCAIYARYSSELQSPMSIADQVRLCRQYAERHGWEVVAVFEDAAISGASVAGRVSYQQLMAEALSPLRPFDVVLVEDLSRLTRELGESDALYRRLRLRGVDLVGVSDGIDTRRKGAAMQIGMKGLMNALFLEDLGDKTHRGLSGRIERGLSAGGRIFGYRAVSVADGSSSKRFAIEPTEAAIVRRIFQDYAAGQSEQKIAHALNAERIPFPAQATKRGPDRRGWAVSTIHTILHNERYAGVWTWNKRHFLRDPDTGRRRPVLRPESEQRRQERPELRIVDADLWSAVQARLAHIREQYGAGGGRPPRNGARPVYSPYLLSGVLRCGVCKVARMSAQTAKRRKGAKAYRYAWYVCGFARDKGPAVCMHRTWYRQSRLEHALLAKFREATTPPMIAWLVDAVNAQLDEADRARDARSETTKRELLRLEHEAGNLVRFLAGGGDSSTVREELRTIEQAIAGLRQELAQLEQRGAGRALRVHRAWVERHLAQLDNLLRTGDVAAARAKILEHLDGELMVTPRLSVAGTRCVEIAGRVRGDSLLALGGQEVVRAVVGCGGWI